MKVAILGFGTVGSGVYEVLRMNRESIKKKAGVELDVKYVLDLREFPGNPVMEVLTHDFEQIVNDPEIRVVAEVMGGVGAAYKFTKAALLAGKSVCTSNKELVAAHGAELLRIARENKASYLFEASVGGGIPVIRPLNDALYADEILAMRSIVNGTTNYILSRMGDEGLAFEAALKEAQAQGFAEADPTADIEGFDALRKTAILASITNQKQVECDDIYREGISKITADDIGYAKKLGAAIKLISYIRRENGKTYAMVAPFMIRQNCQLFNVNGVFNAVTVTGNAVGDIMFFGSGAGKLPTASAVCADICNAARADGSSIETIWSEERCEVESKDSMINAFFVRVPGAEQAQAAAVFDIVETPAALDGEFAFVTGKLTEAQFESKIAQMNPVSVIRVDF